MSELSSIGTGHHTSSESSLRGRSSEPRLRNTVSFDIPSAVSDTDNANLSVGANQLLFKTSSLALLRSRSTDGNWSNNKDTSYIAGARRVVDYMYDLWRQEKLCDLIIRVNDAEVKGHKLAVAAYSDTLAQQFYQFPPEEIVAIDLQQFSRDLVRSIVAFVYTTRIDITDQNIDDTLGCSLHMGIDVIINLCEDYLSHYAISNALLYYAIAEKYDLLKLQNRIYLFILKNFVEISTTANFLYVPFDRLVTLLNEDGLCVPSEVSVFKAILTWIDHNRQERITFAPFLMRCVRLQLLQPEALVTEMEPVSHIFDIRECHNMLYEAMK